MMLSKMLRASLHRHGVSGGHKFGNLDDHCFFLSQLRTVRL